MNTQLFNKVVDNIKNNDLSIVVLEKLIDDVNMKFIVMRTAAEHNHDALKTLHEKYDFDFYPSIIYEASCYKNLDNLIYLKKCGYIPNPTDLNVTMSWAIAANNIDALQFMETEFNGNWLYSTSDIFMSSAIEFNRSSMVEYLHKKECLWACEQWNIINPNECLTALKTAYKLGCPLTDEYISIIKASVDTLDLQALNKNTLF